MIALIGHGNFARLAERHRPVAISSTPEGAVAYGQRIEISLVSMTHAKEISQRNVDTGRLFPVIINPQPDEPRPGVLVVGHGNPDVIHHARSVEVGHDERLARHEALAVVVTAHKAVVAGHSMGGEGLQAGKVKKTERSRVWSLCPSASYKSSQQPISSTQAPCRA